MKTIILTLLVLVATAAQAQFNEFEKAYIVIAGASDSYAELNDQAQSLAISSGVEYSNGYNEYKSGKGLILSADADDEMWAGEYLFRRFGEEHISLEMKHAYFEDMENNAEVMIIVAGIFYNEEEANNYMAEIHDFAPDAYIHTDEVYQGCMH
jgi:hypothetical protein